MSKPLAPTAPFITPCKLQAPVVSQSMYVITSYYYVGQEPDDSAVSVLTYGTDYEKIKQKAMEYAKEILSDMDESLNLTQQDIDEHKAKVLAGDDDGCTIEWSDGVRPTYGIFDQEHTIFVGDSNDYDCMHYGGNESIGDYCIIEIHPVKN